ncbi:MAG: 50S ribosomal protein L13 [Deltaproteobacteria bacterium]|nr:50S ribosomal protein L13 [Deltaproteobacteria bacterium]
MSAVEELSKDNRKWFVVDAEAKTLGRIATRIATVLRGKHKPTYSPSMDMGDFVVVVNAEKVAVSGNKMKEKLYRSYSGYPGGLKELPMWKVIENNPTRVITDAVQGMLPKGPLGRRMLKKLKVYAGTAHPHQAQNPENMAV